MPADPEDQDLRDVMEEEKSRGAKRRPIDTLESKKKRQLEEDALRAIQSGDLPAFVRMLHEAGIRDGTPRVRERFEAVPLFRPSAVSAIE